MAYLNSFHLLTDYIAALLPVLRKFEDFVGLPYYDSADKHNASKTGSERSFH